MTQIPNIIKLATKIPHELVNEKVKMYLYLEEWKQKIKNMHSQYNEKIIIINNNIHFNLKSIETKTNYHQPIIPLLIKEKIQSYLQEIYRQRWLKNIKLMHNQYHKRVQERQYNGNEYLAWLDDAFLREHTQICWLSDNNTTKLRSAKGIDNFTIGALVMPQELYPKKYTYTSGRDNPSAYKYDPSQFKRGLHWSEKKTKYWKYTNPMLQSQ